MIRDHKGKLIRCIECLEHTASKSIGAVVDGMPIIVTCRQTGRNVGANAFCELANENQNLNLR